MILQHRRTEEGQVYPALLLAVIGGFALAVAFVSLQNLLDQTGRAASASDAAALAVGEAHRETVVSLLAADPAGSLGRFLAFLQGAGPTPAADQAAQEFAQANGAQLDGRVTYQGFDSAKREWVYRVSTRQRDTVSSDGATARSQSASKVAVTITGGLCPGLRGVEVDGRCVDAATYLHECVAPPPPPAPDPKPKPKPKPEPTATPPPFEPQGYCGAGLAQLLRWNVHLVH